MSSPSAATATATMTVSTGTKKKFRIKKSEGASVAPTTHAYISQLSPQKKQLLLIAQTHLDTSFHLEETHGFLAWKEQERNK